MIFFFIFIYLDMKSQGFTFKRPTKETRLTKGIRNQKTPGMRWEISPDSTYANSKNVKNDDKNASVDSKDAVVGNKNETCTLEKGRRYQIPSPRRRRRRIPSPGPTI